MNLKSILIISIIVSLVIFGIWLSYPVGQLFTDDYSTIIFDSQGNLIRATLAQDQQYRFPPDSCELPDKYIKALITYEDKRYWYHPGVDLFALLHAMWINIKEGDRIRGASTITMQVARLSEPKERTYLNKILECFLSLKLSLYFSKRNILRLYADHVPMGGNIIGISAASYYYFGRPVSELTWSQAALFAVLPNAPSFINLKKKRPQLIYKRNNLIQKLYKHNIIDAITRDISCREPLPELNQSLPFKAPHFTQFLLKKYRGNHKVYSTLDMNLQEQVESAARVHHFRLLQQGIPNLAVIVAETGTGKIRAYLGSQDFFDQEHNGQVDGCRSHRSTGSLLKPFLVAKVLDRGSYTLASRIQDVPTSYGTFTPQNASKSYRGLISMRQMLIQSLNVPFVRLLNAYGVEDFYDLLKLGGLQGLFRSPQGYGLSLILGGAEANLCELIQLYLSLANMGKIKKLYAIDSQHIAHVTDPEVRLFSAGASWLVLKTLSYLSRPGIEHYWDNFNSHIPVAWKTGTSYGQRDGWAIGFNKQWTIGVWVGDFVGTGNSEISGAKSAAPLLFTLFNLLTRRDQTVWFEEPHHDLKEIPCCKQSGFPVGPFCTDTIIIKHPKKSQTLNKCPYHRRYLIDVETGRSVCSLCWEGKTTSWDLRFIVKPLVREILMNFGQKVDEIPLHADNCPNFYDDKRLELIYPVDGIKAFIPRDLDGNYEKIVFVAKHHNPASQLFWFLNGYYLGDTKNDHSYAIDLGSGEYQLTVQDEEGFSKSVTFSVYKK